MMCTIIIFYFVLAAFTLPRGTMQLPRVLLEQEAHWCAPCLCHPCLKYQTDMHSHSTRIIFESVGSVRKYLTCSTILQVKSRSGHRAIGQFWGESLRTPFFLLSHAWRDRPWYCPSCCGLGACGAAAGRVKRTLCLGIVRFGMIWMSLGS